MSMQKFNHLKDYLLELSFLALLIKILIFGAEISEALAVISLVFSISYNKWLNKNKIDQYDELIQNINSHKEQFQKEIDTLNSKLTGIALDKSIKRVSLNEQESQKPGSSAIKRLF